MRKSDCGKVENMRKSDCGKYEKIRIESVVIVSKIFFKVKIFFFRKNYSGKMW